MEIKDTNVRLIYRIDIGFSEQRGYAAAIVEVNQDGRHRQKGIRGNSPEQLMSRVRQELIVEMNKRKRFPLESEPQTTNGSPIIRPEDGDPLFGAT